MKLIYLFLTLMVPFSKSVSFENLLEDRIKILEKTYNLELNRIYYYKGEKVLNSKHLSTFISCGINIKDIKRIVTQRYLKKDYNYIPITIEMWSFENDQRAMSFQKEIAAKPPLVKCAMLKIECTYFVKNNIVISITGNPKQQSLLGKIYRNLDI